MTKYDRVVDCRELRIASLKSRRLAAVPASALEALRNKQNELQNDKREFKIFCELRVDEINRRTTELLEKEAELKSREEQLQEQWIKFYEINNSSSPTHLSHDTTRSVNSAPSLDRSMLAYHFFEFQNFFKCEMKLQQSLIIFI
ncbi:unnamed protein product [Brugia timori]|uniref:Uncharacterized protein n=1 Tax=Brugia timori TaxID=42155 RepID=A0A0R3R9U6_9BILA|nr:unnamed protein product [Brugia timori]